MQLLCKIVVALLVLSLVQLHGVSITWAEATPPEKPLLVALSSVQQPEQAPALLEDAPVVKKSKVSTWVWVLLGALVVGGGVAAIVGGKSSGGGGGFTPAGGTATIGW